MDRHFPRIEYVRDSFGNTPTGAPPNQYVQTDLTLHPGDEISFEGSGWDPQDGPLKWVMVVFPGEDPAVEEQGRQASFLWRVTEANISTKTFVHLRLISDRPWHREAGHDDEKVFIYTVLPR